MNGGAGDVFLLSAIRPSVRSQQPVMAGRERLAGRGLAIALLLASNVVLALDGDLAITQYGHRVWRTDEGLPQNSVFSITQSRDGYLWLATQEGLARFDGMRFRVFDKRNTPEIRHNDVWTLLEDRAGNLWIGTRGGGLSRFADGTFTNYSKQDGLSNDSVQSITEDKAGNLWIGTRGGGLNRYRDGQFKAYTQQDGLSHNTVFAVLEDREGTIWLGTDGGGLNRYRDGKFSALTSKDGLSSDIVFCIYQDRGGALWIGTSAGLNRLKDGKFTAFRVKDGLSNDNIRTLFEDRSGNLWIGTDGGGLNRLSQGRFSSYTSKDGLSSDSIGAIYEDREGSLWVGSDAGGLNRFKDGKFTSYTSREGLSNDNARAVYEDREGNLWIGTFGGLNRYRDGKFTTYTKKHGLSSDVVLSIAEDRAGSLWLGTLGAGLNRFKDGKFTVYTKKQGLSNETVLTLLEDRAGTLWVGTRSGGLNALRDGKFTAYTTQEGLSSNDVRTLLEDRDGSLWIGTLGGGLNRYHDGKFTAYTTKDGLAHDLVLSLHQDASGVLWIGTFGGGLSRYKEGKFTAISTKDGLFDDVVYRILEDDAGRLWMSSNRGISSVAIEDLNNFADGKTRSVASVAYGKADGMSSTEGNGAHQPAGWRGKNGRLWFPTIAGVVSIDPARIRTNTQAPPVRIEEILVDNAALADSSGVELPPGKQKFEFHYTGLSFLAPDKVHFRYRLDGFDKDWVDAGTVRTAYYTNIPPGSYKFRVKASNDDGVWSEDEASYAFELRPYFYQRKSFVLFYVLCAAGLVLLGLRVHRIRVRKLEAHADELRQHIEERKKAEAQLAREAQELARSNADLERFAYVASHDLQEPLRAISSYTQLLTQRYADKGDQNTVAFTGFITDGVRRMRDIIEGVLAYSRVTLDTTPVASTDVNLLLQNALANLHSAIKESGAVVTHDPLPTLGIHAQEITQLFQNLVGNALKFRSQEPPRIHVSAQRDGREWTFSVRDNGIGIDPQYADQIFELFQSLHTRDVYPGNGLGLAICKKIVERKGGRIWVEAAPPRGSVFRFTLPAQ